jgi:hypothetical protein
MPSDVEICNLALSFIGTGTEIASFTERSPEARACNQFYEVARDEMLREWPWPFAGKAATLGEVDEDPALFSDDGWAYSYRYPSDCLFARRIISGVPVDQQGTRVDYKIVQDDEGLLILTNAAEAILEYTYRAEDTVRFPSDFVLALAYRIAAYIAPRLAKDPSRVAPLVMAMYDKSCAKARRAAGNEEKHTVSESEFIDGR